MTGLKLLMLNYEFPPIGGGAGQSHLRLLKEYAKDKRIEKIDVLTSAPKPGFFVENMTANITIYKVGIHKKNLHFWRKTEVLEWLIKACIHYRSMLRRNSYDLVHAFFGMPTGLLCYITTGRLPYIISLRGSDVPGRHTRLKVEYKLFGPILKQIWKKAAAVTANSEGLKKRALRFMPSASIDVIHNGVELDRFSPPAARGISEPLKLLTVGRLSATKRIEMLIDTVELLHKSGHKVQFTIVGGGELLDDMSRLVREKNLSEIIQITDRIENEKMPEIYRRHDIFVSATMQEGMSNAMLEAAASGLPIITTRCEGLEELIKDNGIIVEQPAAQNIAEAIKQLAADRSCHENMSLAALKNAGQFDWPSVANEYFNCYKKIIEK